MEIIQRSKLKKKELLSNDSDKSWSSISKVKKNYRLISEYFKYQCVPWICNYDKMVHSPITDDTILVVNELTGKKTKRVGKLLLTCSVTELNNNLIKDINDGGLKDVWNDSKLLVSETGVRLFYMIN